MIGEFLNRALSAWTTAWTTAWMTAWMTGWVTARASAFRVNLEWVGKFVFMLLCRANRHARSHARVLRTATALALATTIATTIATTSVHAQDEAPPEGSAGVAAAPTKLAIAVPQVTALPAIIEKAKGYGQQNELAQVVEGLDAKFGDALMNSRKFDVRAHAELKRIIGDQQAQDSGNYDLSDPSRAKPFKLAGIPYLALVQIDDFQDQVQSANFEGVGTKATRRQIRLSATCRIFDTTRGTTLESTRLTLSDFDFKNNPQFVVDQKGGDLTEGVVNVIADRMANELARRVTDVIFPAKILVVRESVVTLNRGDGTGIAVGEIWEVSATGEDLIDPDTGENLGSEEVDVGFVRVISVAPKFSRAEICGANRGIAKGCIVRKTARTSCESAVPAQMYSPLIELAEERLLRESGAFASSDERDAAPPLPNPQRTPTDGPPVPPVPPGSNPATDPATGSATTAPTPIAAIFIKNREKRIDDNNVMVLEDYLVAALDGTCFTTMSREDSINAVARFARQGANAGVDGDPLKDLDRVLSNDTSAVQLAQSMGADYVLVASITALSVDRRKLNDPTRGVQTDVESFRLDATYRILGRAEGRVIASGSASATESIRHSPELQIERDVVADLLRNSAEKMATAMRKRCATSPLPPPDQLEQVVFEIIGTPADLAVPDIVKNDQGNWVVTSGSYTLEPTSFMIEIDGVVVASYPNPAKTSKGLHKIRVTRPGYEPYQGIINVQPGIGSLVIPMRMTTEEIVRWQQMSAFFQQLKREQQLTAAEADVLAGYAEFLRNSKVSIQYSEETKSDVKVDTTEAPVFENNSFWHEIRAPR